MQSWKYNQEVKSEVKNALWMSSQGSAPDQDTKVLLLETLNKYPYKRVLVQRMRPCVAFL